MAKNGVILSEKQVDKGLDNANVEELPADSEVRNI